MTNLKENSVEQLPSARTSQADPYQLDDRPSEVFTIVIIILLGMLGVYHVGSNYKQPSVYNTSATLDQSDVSQFTALSSKSNVNKDPNFEGQLIVDGIPEALEKLTFNISNYDAHVEYTLDLGNGKVLHPDSKSVEYLYTESGSYLVELTASYQGQQTTLYSEFVDITEAIEVAYEARVDI